MSSRTKVVHYSLMDIPVGAVLSIVTTTVKLVRGDPVLKALKDVQCRLSSIQDSLERQLAGPLRSGETALADSLHASSAVERGRLISEATEYFRNAYHLAEGVQAARCAEYVAFCYEAKGETGNSRTWLARSDELILDEHTRSVETVDRNHPKGSVGSLELLFLAMQSALEVERFARDFNGRHPSASVNCTYLFKENVHSIKREKNFFRDNVIVLDMAGRPVLAPFASGPRWQP